MSHPRPVGATKCRLAWGVTFRSGVRHREGKPTASLHCQKMLVFNSPLRNLSYYEVFEHAFDTFSCSGAFLNLGAPRAANVLQLARLAQPGSKGRFGSYRAEWGLGGDTPSRIVTNVRDLCGSPETQLKLSAGVLCCCAEWREAGCCAYVSSSLSSAVIAIQETMVARG